MRLRVLLEPLHGASYDQILALARATEESGFDAFFRSDHYQGVDPDDTGYRPTDSWTTLAGLAVQTERVRLGTLMTASTYRRPGPLAITVATVDAMSGGRAELGIGAAWIEQEHRYLGIPFPSLGERFDRLGEQLEIITGLWATPHPRAGRPVRRRVQQRHAGRAGRAVRELPADLRAVRPGPGRRPAVHHAAGVLRADPRRDRPPRRRPGRGRRPDAGDGRHRHARRRPRPPGRTARGRRRHRLLPPVRRHGPRTTSGSSAARSCRRSQTFSTERARLLAVTPRRSPRTARASRAARATGRRPAPPAERSPGSARR